MNGVLGALLFIGGPALFAVLGVSLTRKRLQHHVREGHNDVLVPIFLTAGTLYAVLLGFMVIAVWESYEKARDNVADEATSLVPLYRFTNGMTSPEAGHFRATIREYAEAVIHDEWPLQATTGASSPVARRHIGNLLRDFKTMDPLTRSADAQINAAFLQTVSGVVSDRNRRGVQAGESLPWAMWLGVILGAVVTIGMSFLLFMERKWPHVVMAGLLAGLIGTMLFMALALSHPFNGPLALSAEPFERTLHVLDDVDRGN